MAPCFPQNASKNHPKSIKNRLKTKVKFRHRFYCIFKPKLTKKSTPEIQKTLSLYWYLQYFAALGLFALIRLWVLIFIQISISFRTKNQPKSNKNAIQNRIDFLIKFWIDFFWILTPFWLPFGSLWDPFSFGSVGD